MRNQFILSVLASSIFCCAIPLAAAPQAKLNVTLTIEPNTTLPGLSVPLLLRVENQGPAVFLSPFFRIRATSPNGESFFVDFGEPDMLSKLDLGVTDEDDPRFPLPARRTVELAVPAGNFGGGTWARDGRLVEKPGEWTLQVYLFQDLSNADDTSDELGARDPAPTGISNPATVIFEIPGPRDLPIWEALRRGEYVQIAQTVLATQPESPYFPYFITSITGLSTAEKIGIYEKAISLHPTSPAVPSVRYALALAYGREANRVFDEEGDLGKAVELADSGRAELMRLRNAKDPWSRLVANEKLGEFPTREAFMAMQRLKEKYKRR